VATWKDGNKNLHTAHFTCLCIYYLQLVSSIVDVHLVTGKMLHMAYGLGLIPVVAYRLFEIGVLITIRVLLEVLSNDITY
jgi:hypothetical protein